MKNRLFIIIPVHNRKDYTHNCLISLKRQTDLDFDVVVVDDGSTDGTSLMIVKDFPEVILLKGNGNLWWSRATNLGIEYALTKGARYILMLNNDTVLHEDFIEKMMFWAKKKPQALLGAFAIDAATGEPVYGGEIINWINAGYHPIIDKLKPDRRYGLHKVTHFPGRGLLIPAPVFAKIGLFDARHLPQTAADYDFTHRAIRAGYTVYCNYDAKILVYPQASGDVQLRNKKSLKNYYNHLFGIKGGGNLTKFFIYAIRNCPFQYLLPFMVIGTLRRIFGYLMDWIAETLKLTPKPKTP